MNSLFALYCHVDDPIHFEDAIKDKKGIEVMDEEMNAIERNKTLELNGSTRPRAMLKAKLKDTRQGWLSRDTSSSMRETMRKLSHWLQKWKPFNMQECKTTITPTVMGLKLSKEDNNKDVDPRLYKSIVGSLMYLTATRPDIMFVVSLISRFMERPKEAHWQAAKRILRYVKGTKRFDILYNVLEHSDLVGYTDSDWAGSVDDRKSTSSYVFHMDSGAISWASKKQPIVALSTTEAEYVAATAAACQAVWMRRMLRSLG
eukprot:PITA_06314